MFRKLFIAFLVVVIGRPRYLLLGIQPFNFKWSIDLPYTEQDQMRWSKENSWEELDKEYHLILRVVDLYTGSVTEIYSHGSDVFAWTFLEARGIDNHPHPNGGYWWIDLDTWDW